MLKIIALSGLALLLCACAEPSANKLPTPQQLLPQNYQAYLHQQLAIIASDEFEGRLPASPGEEKTVNYLRDEFKRLGLQPGNGKSYFQDVPLVAITAIDQQPLNIDERNLVYGQDMMIWSKRVQEKVRLSNSPLVFVGYGINAPEYNWNDYANLDVTGKTVLILVNDPGYASQDPELFTGNAMTYYGRWMYKFEEAARQGASGALIIHETAAAAYPWSVVEGSWSGPQFDLAAANNNQHRVLVEGWLSSEQSQTLLGKAGLTLDQAKAKALSPDFQALDLAQQVSVEINNHIKKSNSRNVIAMITGTDKPEEVIIHTSHWDHLGTNKQLDGDQIYNGAVDNASGTAGLLTLAKAYQASPIKPKRSVVFLAVTAEEQGLLGSLHYGRHPVFPLNKTIAAINMDGLNVYGRTKDVVVVGWQNSELEHNLKLAAELQGRHLSPEPTPEKGSFYRSDHFSLAKVGVPALYLKAGIDNLEHGKAWGLAQFKDYTANRYHKPQDNYDPNWDLSGAIEDLQLHLHVGMQLVLSNTYPNWFDGKEFKAARDNSMGTSP